jgi:hypothetical protein
MKTISVGFLIGCVIFSSLMADIMTETKDSITSITNSDDLLSYTNHKAEKEYIANLKKKYNGLANDAILNELLKQQNYIEVLNYLWTEPNSGRKITWLEEKVKEGHPILMFELGSEYYTQNPTIETYANKTVPWLLAGAKRTMIDTACSSDKTLEDSPEFLLMNYQQDALEDLQSKHSQEEIEKYFEMNEKELRKINFGILKKVMEPFVNNKWETMPSPKWIFPHGMGAFISEKNLISSSKCNKIRKKQAEEFLKDL